MSMTFPKKYYPLQAKKRNNLYSLQKQYSFRFGISIDLIPEQRSNNI